MGMNLVLRLVTLMLVGTTLVAGCAQADRSADPTAPTTADPGASMLSSTPPPRAGTPSGPPKQPNDGFAVVTVSGVLQRTGGCTQLVTDTVTWELLGAAVTTLRDGDRVQVTGLPSPQLESACGGSPLMVSSVANR